MKKTVRRGLLSAAAILLAAVMAAPVGASSVLDTLFYEELHNGEHLIRRVEREGFTHRAHDLDYYTDWTHVTRSFIRSLTVDEDVVVGDMIRVLIPEGETLTVAEGSTLTVHGQLAVEGTLVNNGTIIIGDRRGYKEEDGVDPYRKSVLLNEGGGSVNNAGTIEVVRGEIHNEGLAAFTNSGDIHILNRDDDLVGMVNSTIMRTSPQPGVIVNDGVIFVDNQGGYGIRSDKNAIFENNGEIAVTYDGNVAATITGYPAVRAADEAGAG